MRNTKSPNRKKPKLQVLRTLKSGASRRHIGTTHQLYPKFETKSLSNSRLLSLDHSKQMGTIKEYNWLQLGPTSVPFGHTDSDSRVIASGRITSIAIDHKHPDIIYLGAALGGIWKTIDSGRNWKAKSDQNESLAIGALVMDPIHNNILYAGTGEGNLIEKEHPMSYHGVGVLKTENSGEKWELKGKAIFTGARFFRLAVNHDDTQIIFAATSNGVYRSLDGGENWKPMTNGLPETTNDVKVASDLVIDPNNPNIVYAAFWADGIYKTENANGKDDEPLWKKISKDISAPNIQRIALSISKTNPNILYALMSNGIGVIEYFYRTENGGSSWVKIDLSLTIYVNKNEYNINSNPGIGDQGDYNLNITVDPTDSNIVYLSGIPLLKAIRNPRSGKWRFIDIGRNIHADNHAFAFHPTDNMIIFTGNDGGIYKSTNGGITWDDTLNEGLCITQFTFMDQHPNSDAVMIAGTQDNGTLQFRNNSVFYSCDDGDGGFVAIDPKNPLRVFHERYDPTIMRSDEGGSFGDYENGGSWKPLYNRDNLFGKSLNGSLFFPPFTLDQSNSNNIALGTKNIYLYDQIQNKSNEPEQYKWDIIKIPELSSGELISAINYVNSNQIYVGTTKGKIFLLENIDNKWTRYKLESNNDTLADNYISDIAIYHENNNDLKNSNIIVALGGFIEEQDPSRIWRGEISADKKVEWKNISGTENAENAALPRGVPTNAIAIDFSNPKTIFIGNDIGVFRTTDGGESWQNFGIGLPKSSVEDMRILHYKDDSNSMRLLRVVTHGRGMWEVELDKRNNKNEVDLYVRDHIMDTGRFTPSLSGIVKSSFEDPFRNILFDDKGNLKFDDSYDNLFWWMCADIKVDPPYYQMDIDEVDYVKFESRIRDKNPIKFETNRIYVQIHNRGIKDAGTSDGKVCKLVSIKLLYANVTNSPGSNTPFIPALPDIPQNFWTEITKESNNLGNWKQIGETKFLPKDKKTLTNIEPTVLCWEWKPLEDVLDRVGLLVIIDSLEDPIPQINKEIFDIGTLVRNEKHIGVKIVKVDPPRQLRT